MKKLAVAIVLLSTPAMADTLTGVSGGPPQSTVSGGPPAPQTGGGALLDNSGYTACHPIGKTNKGDLVYSMDCQNVPVTYTTSGSTVYQLRRPLGIRLARVRMGIAAAHSQISPVTI